MSASLLATQQTISSEEAISPEEELSASHEAVRRSLYRPFPAPAPADRWRIESGDETIADVRLWLSRLDGDSFYRLAVALHGEEWRRRRGFDLGVTEGRLDPIPASDGAERSIEALASEAAPRKFE